ncbi:MAG TPA: ATP-binding protein [Anaerolineae bacterium]|nr:ATP-binding protein [Anaerolineae bacterium]
MSALNTSRANNLQDTRNVYALSVFLTVALALIGAVGEALRVVEFSLIPAVLCGVAGMLESVAGLVLASRVRNLTALNGVISVAYVVTATLAIHFAGGPQSFLPGLYIGITIAAAFLVGLRGALAMALLSIACFGVLISLMYTGRVPIYPLWAPLLDLRGREVILGALILSVAVPTLVVAYAAGTLADRLAWRTAEQTALAWIARDIASSLDANRVIHTVLKRALEHTLSWHGEVHLFEEDRQQVRIVAIEGPGLAPEYARAGMTWPLNTGIVGRVLRTGQTARVGDVSLDPDYFAAAPRSRSELCVPIIQDGRVDGVINLESDRLNAFSDAHQRYVEQLAQHAAVALKNARLHAATQRTLVEVERANREARTVRDRLQAVLDATHDGLILFDAQTRMVLANRAAEELLNVSLAPHLGRLFAEVLDRSGLLDRLHPFVEPVERLAALETEVREMATLLRAGTTEVARRLITVPKAETRFVEELSLRVQDDRGLVLGRLVVLHDVTDQKQLEIDREAFTQMLVHDLRSPLSAVISGLQLIDLGIREGDSSDLLLRSSRIALASSHKLLDLIGALLDVQKLETGQVDLQLQPLAPASLIQDVVETLRPLAEAARISLGVDADYTLPPVLGDPEHVRRVLTNLVDNALKFVGTGGTVRLSAARDSDLVRFSVADDGPGIPEEYRERVFDRYIQVPDRVGRRRGTGLGLTYCKMVVKKHAGNIWIESVPGGGSNFLFTLPIAAQ